MGLLRKAKSTALSLLGVKSKRKRGIKKSNKNAPHKRNQKNNIPEPVIDNNPEADNKQENVNNISDSEKHFKRIILPLKKAKIIRELNELDEEGQYADSYGIHLELEDLFNKENIYNSFNKFYFWTQTFEFVGRCLNGNVNQEIRDYFYREINDYTDDEICEYLSERFDVEINDENLIDFYYDKKNNHIYDEYDDDHDETKDLRNILDIGEQEQLFTFLTNFQKLNGIFGTIYLDDISNEICFMSKRKNEIDAIGTYFSFGYFRDGSNYSFKEDIFLDLDSKSKEIYYVYKDSYQTHYASQIKLSYTACSIKTVCEWLSCLSGMEITENNIHEKSEALQPRLNINLQSLIDLIKENTKANCYLAISKDSDTQGVYIFKLSKKTSKQKEIDELLLKIFKRKNNKTVFEDNFKDVDLYQLDDYKDFFAALTQKDKFWQFEISEKELNRFKLESEISVPLYRSYCQNDLSLLGFTSIDDKTKNLIVEGISNPEILYYFGLEQKMASTKPYHYLWLKVINGAAILGCQDAKDFIRKYYLESDKEEDNIHNIKLWRFLYENGDVFVKNEMAKCYFHGCKKFRIEKNYYFSALLFIEIINEEIFKNDFESRQLLATIIDSGIIRFKNFGIYLPEFNNSGKIINFTRINKLSKLNSLFMEEEELSPNRLLITENNIVIARLENTENLITEIRQWSIENKHYFEIKGRRKFPFYYTEF